jgi:hypothetical protein
MIVARLLVGAVAAGLVALAVPASAAPITSTAGLVGVQQLVTFSQFTGGNTFQGVNGPVQIGGSVGENIVVTDVSGGGNIWLYDGGWGLGDNGSWDSGRAGFLGIFDEQGPLRINFNSGNVGGFGFFMNVVTPGAEFQPVVLRAYDSGGGLLEAFDVTATANISTPGALNAGAFRGIQLAGNNIAYIELLGDTAVFDDFRFSRIGTAPVPEPSLLALLALGVGGVIGVQRRKRVN